jgi:hypothetical protein
MPKIRNIAAGFLVCASLGAAAYAQDQAPLSNRGRKYKAPPPTSHIEVIVLRSYNGKPVANAAVVFHSLKDNKDEGNLEVKTNEEGKAIIDVIPTGSKVGIQVIADGFATYADEYQVNEIDRTITVKMLRPRAQVSEYIDNFGKPAQMQPGVQEPNHPSSPPVVQPPQPTNHTSDPSPLAPIDPNATPGNSQNPTPKPAPQTI